MDQNLRALIDRLTAIEEGVAIEGTLGGLIAGAIAANAIDLSKFNLSQFKVANLNLPFLNGTPKGYKPYQGDKISAYNRFWDNDIIPNDVHLTKGGSNSWHQARGTYYIRDGTPGDYKGELIAKVENGRPVMAATFTRDYDDYVRSKGSTVEGAANRTTVYVKI